MLQLPRQEVEARDVACHKLTTQLPRQEIEPVDVTTAVNHSAKKVTFRNGSPKSQRKGPTPRDSPADVASPVQVLAGDAERRPLARRPAPLLVSGGKRFFGQADTSLPMSMTNLQQRLAEIAGTPAAVSAGAEQIVAGGQHVELVTAPGPGATRGAR